VDANGNVRTNDIARLWCARFPDGECFDFFPNFRTVMSTNHKPVIKGNDLGICRRVNQIPFMVTIPLRERDLY